MDRFLQIVRIAGGAAGYLGDRLKEPSTHAAITALAVLVHVSHLGPVLDQLSVALGVISGTAGVILKEAGAPPAP